MIVTAAIRLMSATITTAAAKTICRKCPTATAVKNRAVAATATEAATAAASVPRTAATATVAAAAAASAAAFPVFSAAVADRTYP